MPRPSSATISVLHYSSTVAECLSTTLCGQTITSTTSGSLLTAYVYWATAAGDTFVCSSGMTNNGTAATWAEADHKTNTVFSIYICYAPNVASGITTATATLTGATNTTVGLIVAEVAGLATSTPLDVHTNGTGSGTSFSVGPTSTTTVTNEYAACILAKNGAGDPISGVGANFTARVASTNTHMNYLDAIMSSTGTRTCSANLAGSVTEWDVVIATFKAPASAVVRRRAQVIGQ
jgi:hypothetical protein